MGSGDGSSLDVEDLAIGIEALSEARAGRCVGIDALFCLECDPIGVLLTASQHGPPAKARVIRLTRLHPATIW